MKLLMLLLSVAPIAHAGSIWISDAPDSRLEFLVQYEGETSAGVFERFNVTLNCGANGPAGGSLDVVVQISSADMDSADLNAEIVKPVWFAASRFTTSHFVSQSIEETDDGHFVAHGRLTLKGVERDVDVPFSWQQDGDSARMQGRVELVRTDYGIGEGEWASDDPIGIDVGVRFDVRLHPR